MNYEKNYIFENNFIKKFCLSLKGLTCIIGGGGKTSLMMSTLDFLVSNEVNAAAGVTAEIIRPEYPGLSVISFSKNQGGPEAEKKILNSIEKRLFYEKSRQVLYHGLSTTKIGKLTFENARKLAEKFEIIICESDGSRGLPFKAFADHEPAIEGIPDILIISVGAELFENRPFEEVIFRPELFKRATSIKSGQQVESDHIALSLKYGNCAQIIAKCPRVYLFFNKIDLYVTKDTVFESRMKCDIIEKCFKAQKAVKQIWPHIRGACISVKHGFGFWLETG